MDGHPLSMSRYRKATELIALVHFLCVFAKP